MLLTEAQTKAENLKIKFESIMNKKLPSGIIHYIDVYKSFDGGINLKIVIASSNHKINGVSGQLPDIVSLRYSFTYEELKPQSFGCCGGQKIHIQPDKEDPREKYLALTGVKIPFRKPKNKEKNLVACVGRFCENWLKTLNENRSRLLYGEFCNNYEFLN